MTIGSYRQFCPVAMAAEIFCTRWTIVLLRELTAGSTRFNELRRGVPRMSPALLSQRLKDLDFAGIVVAHCIGVGSVDLRLSSLRIGPRAGADRVRFRRVGSAAHRRRRFAANLDVQLLMWDMRRNLNPTPMPPRQGVVQFLYPELPAAQRSWWFLVDPATGVDLCSIDPGFDVDLYVTVDLRTMTAIWMGLDTVRAALASQRMILTGSRQLSSAMQTWLG